MQSIENEAMGIEEMQAEAPDLNAGALGSEAQAEGIGLGDIFSKIVDLFRVETGQGELKDYIDCPLNFDRSEGLAQILRGAAGFLGANFLRSAVLDIVIGWWRWIGKGKASA